MAIQCADYLWEELQGYAQPLSMAGHTLALTAVVGEPLANCLWESANFGYVLVVPDAVAAALPVECRTLAVMTTQPLSQETFQALRQVQRQYNQADPDYYDSVASRVDREEEYAATSTMTVFPLFYLALVLTLTAAAILTVQQLSETARYRQQFTLLHKLGMDRREMVQALRRQFAIYYTMPAVPPGAHRGALYPEPGPGGGAGDHGGAVPAGSAGPADLGAVLCHLSAVYPAGLPQFETECAAGGMRRRPEPREGSGRRCLSQTKGGGLVDLSPPTPYNKREHTPQGEKETAMIRLECDYAEGAHERVLRRLFETNLEQTPGYGEDAYCAQARARIRALCENEALDVHFLVGGTQTNTTVIAAALRPHQGVIAAASGHINVHETGAIEATGHKVLAVPSADGKLTALDVRRVWEAHWQDETREHMVQPGMVYLSQPTENGTLYALAELDDLWQTCQDCGLFLYVDGARLGYAS